MLLAYVARPAIERGSEAPSRFASTKETLMAKRIQWLMLTGASVLVACGAQPGDSSVNDDFAVESNDALTIPEGQLYNARISASGKCAVVENSSQADGARVIQLPCSQAGANGRWDIVSIGGDVYQLRASHSGKCLNV